MCVCASARAFRVLCCVVLCCAVLCCAMLCCLVLCCAVLRCVVLCCVALCCAVLRCVVCVRVYRFGELPVHTGQHWPGGGGIGSEQGV